MKIRLSVLLSLIIALFLTMPEKGKSSLPQSQPYSALSPTPTRIGETSLSQSMLAAGSQNVQLVSQTGGANFAVAVQGSYAYIGVGPRLVVLNISNPANPIFTGQTSVFPRKIEGLAVAGHYAYVADGGGGLRIIDVYNPFAPIEVGLFPVGAIDVAVEGNYAYVTDSNSLHVINVNNPTSPVDIGFYNSPSVAWGIAISGSYAYIGAWYDGLRIINISNPASPTEVGFYDTPDAAWGIAVAGNYAYVADGNSGLRIINVSNPASPTEVGFYDNLLVFARDVAVEGAYVYLASDNAGLHIINVGDPTKPIKVGVFDTPGWAISVAIAGNYAYVADGFSGLKIINIVNPVTPTLAAFYDRLGITEGIAVEGNYAYVAGSDGLRIINIANPATPTEIGVYHTPMWTTDVAVVGNLAYITKGSWGLRIIDISNPQTPTEVGHCDPYTSGSYYSLAVAGGYAYIADGFSGLRIINISNPVSPTEVGFYDTPGSAEDVSVVGNYAYVADGVNGLRIINISNPVSPTEVGFYDTPDATWGIAVAGGYAYIADGFSGLRIINISNPVSPTEVGFYDTPGSAEDVSVVGNYAYVADNSSLRVIDISNPAVPTEVGFHATADLTRGVVVTGTTAYIADFDGGIFILRYTAEGEPLLSISHIEVSQATQRTSNGTPLIAGKPTFVRVYVDCIANCTNVTGVLRGFGPGGELPGSPLSPILSINAEHEQDWTTQRDVLKKTLNFTIPLQWTSGTVTLVVEIAREKLSEEVTFQQRRQINVVSVPIRYNNQDPDLSRIQQGFTWALRVYPTHRINYISGTTIEWDRCLKFGNNCLTGWNNAEALLNELTSRYRLLNAYVFGWLPDGTFNGGRSDPKWDGGTGQAAFGDDHPTEGQRIFAHEIGHLLGRRHTNTTNACGDVPVDPDTDWNFPNSYIQEWGLDGFGFGWLVSSSTSIKNPASTFDYMSYCGSLSDFNVWTSSWTYERIYDALLLETNSLEGQPLATPSPYFISSGLVFTDDTATLDPIWVITATTLSDNPPVGTQYCLEAQNESGVTLTSQCFDLSFIDYETGETINVDGFNLMLPYPTGVVRIVLKKGSKELAVRSISANIPVVNIISPVGGELWAASSTYTITWTANDLDSDLLTYNVSYSPDGNNWLPVGATITETQITVNAAELPGGTTARIRVMTTDGVNTTTADSASFTVERKGPWVIILSPEKDGAIYPDTPLLLQGYAYDLEDGTLLENALQWSSDRDGGLGTGSVVLTTLSLGEHIITFTAIDSDGNMNSSSIKIFGGSKIYLPLVSR